jgi:hypothetical protein
MSSPWSSADAAVVDIDAAGKAKAVGAGDTEVHASVAGKMASLAIRVIQ